MPQFNINFNRVMSCTFILLAGLVSHYAPEGLREMLAVFIAGLQGSVSVKAQTLNPNGSKIDPEVGEKEGQQDEGFKENDERTDGN